MPYPSKQFLSSCLMMLFISKYCLAEKEFFFESFCADGNSPAPFPLDGESSSGILLMNLPNAKGSSYDPGLNCSVTLQAQSGFNLFLTFSLISLRNVTTDNLTVIHSEQNASISLSGQQECMNENCTNLKFESGRGNPSITLWLQSGNITVPKDLTGFAAVFTVFDLANTLAGECYDENLFLCKNNHCIWNGLVCDGHNNCGDRSDELSCGNSILSTIWGIAVVVMGAVAMMLFVPVFCFLAIRGTQNQVISVAVPPRATPLYPTLHDGETANLLSSSEVPVYFGSEEFQQNSNYSINYGALPGDSTAAPSTSKDEGSRFKSYISGDT